MKTAKTTMTWIVFALFMVSGALFAQGGGHGGGNGGGGMGGDHGGMGGGGDQHQNDFAAVEVTIEGTVAVDLSDSTQCLYSLTDAEGIFYVLNFGPANYEPDSGATRPADGDYVTIFGGMYVANEENRVIVYEINGLFWRDPHMFIGGGNHGGNEGGNGGHHVGDHGGNGGMGDGEHGGNGGHGGMGNGGEFGGYAPEDLTEVTISGVVTVIEMMNHAIYQLTADGVEYHLSFGPADYEPESGATRPEDGDTVDLVAGLWENEEFDFPVLVVFEINGLFWRENICIAPERVVVDRKLVKISNYPNPFNPETVLSIALENASVLDVSIYNIRGERVRSLVNSNLAAGTHAFVWNGSNDEGVILPSGMYLVNVRSASQNFTHTMHFLK